MQRIKEKPPSNLFPGGPDWEWEDNLKHWHCTTEDGFKAILWLDWLNPPDPDAKQKKISKSGTADMKTAWDGICMGVPGGPDWMVDQKAGPILSWIRRGIAQQRLRRALRPEQLEALRTLKDLGGSLSGSAWDVHLASRWGKDPETGRQVLMEKMILDTGALKALASLPIGE